ncbi:MAG: CoB--CoM heterodisulfide reductase iron-sulfur subunit A family protein [Magnetococcales bacterium]|nr:CoB--CoM heterodisulfide reductase iron-sulfur subunit A family protein [Magnetococcales bacterium]NGZ25895.1 CoB--CoM heterodisulfide reductase iron-sulfur subunit A family protein [Magnetococcales bacterium]
MADGRATSQTILVVGGGMSGLTAALEAAEVGHEVLLLEKNPYLGGRVAQLNKYFPKLCTPACGLEINFQRIRNNPRISVLTMAEVEEITGQEGDFRVRIRQNPRFVSEKCTGCGDCSKACETQVDDPFNFNLGKVKAIRSAYESAYPHHYIMDADFAKSDEAKKLVSVCKVGAIEPEMTSKTVEVPVTSIVWATGWQPYDAEKIHPYGFGRFANVTTNMRFERLASRFGPTGGKLVRPSDGKEARRVAFIQCAGSRDHNHLAYCSRICCLASMKQATYVREQYPDAEVTIYYIDLRAMDRYEGFQKKVEKDPGIRWIKSKPARIDEDAATGNPIVIGENTLTGIRYADAYDLVVLATGMQPSVDNVPAQGMQYDDYRFVVNQGNGIIASGCSASPLDVASAVQSSTAASLKAIQSMAKGKG